MKKFGTLLLNRIVYAADSPMNILGRGLMQGQGQTNKYFRKVSSPLGIPQLWKILTGTGVLLAVIVVLAQLIKLLIVNYPKTVTQTKQKVVHAFFVVAVIASLAFVFDTVLDVCQRALGMGYF